MDKIEIDARFKERLKERFNLRNVKKVGSYYMINISCVLCDKYIMQWCSGCPLTTSTKVSRLLRHYTGMNEVEIQKYWDLCSLMVLKKWIGKDCNCLNITQKRIWWNVKYNKEARRQFREIREIMKCLIVWI